jgi:hypothetical protein
MYIWYSLLSLRSTRKSRSTSQNLSVAMVPRLSTVTHNRKQRYRSTPRVRYFSPKRNSALRCFGGQFCFRHSRQSVCSCTSTLLTLIKRCSPRFTHFDEYQVRKYSLDVADLYDEPLGSCLYILRYQYWRPKELGF